MPTPEEATGRTLVHGGPVLVLDGATPEQESLVIADGQILGVGTEEDIKGLAGSGSHLLDLDGATPMPGLVDGHSHQLHLISLTQGLVDILDARGHNEIIERIRARAAVAPPEEWIMAIPVGEPTLSSDVRVAPWTRNGRPTGTSWTARRRQIP